MIRHENALGLLCPIMSTADGTRSCRGQACMAWVYDSRENYSGHCHLTQPTPAAQAPEVTASAGGMRWGLLAADYDIFMPIDIVRDTCFDLQERGFDRVAVTYDLYEAAKGSLMASRKARQTDEHTPKNPAEQLRSKDPFAEQA